MGTLVVVTPNGKAHGMVENIDDARKLPCYKEGSARILTAEDWQQIVNNPDRRVELCGTLGTKL